MSITSRLPHPVPARPPAQPHRSALARALAVAALSLAAGTAQAQALSLMGESVTITFAGTAKPGSPTLPGFGTITSHIVGAAIELTQASHSSYSAYFGSGSIAFDLTGNGLQVVYTSGPAGGGSRVDDMAFTVQLNNPLRAFAAAPTQVYDFFESRTLQGQGWVPVLNSPNVMSISLMDLAAPGGSGYTTGAEFSFNLVAANPVPEPQTYALLAVGLVLIGAVLRRGRAGRGS